MKAKITFAVMAALLVANFGQNVLAQGKGGGLNRALGATSKAGGSGLGKSSNGLSRAGSNLARSNGLNRAAGGLPRGTGAAPVEGDPALANQQRIMDHRLQQAEHLRGISERNGNERLLDTADRMEASAARNFERRTGVVVQPPTDGSVPPADGSSPPAGETTTVTSDGTNVAPVPALQSARPKKPNGFWFKSR